MKKTIRYLVEFPNSPIPVGYNTGLGNRESLSWAIHTACRFYGRITAQFADGTEEIVRDYSPTARQTN